MSGLEVLERRIYVMSDVDRYSGLPAGTARRWVDGYSRGGRDYPPVIRESTTGDEMVSWGEFVEACLLAEFRDRGVTLQRLRPAVQRLRQELGVPYPLATARPFLDTDGKELVRRVQESTDLDDRLQLVVVRSGQLILSGPTDQFVKKVTYGEDGVAAAISWEGPVSSSPVRAGGRPAIRGVPAEVLAEGFRAGESAAELARLYELDPADVEAALRYEMRATQRAIA